MNLANPLALDMFLDKLTFIEECNQLEQLSDHMQDFVKDMRSKFESRETAIDLGAPPWSPSTNQMNYLTHVYEICK